MARWLPRPKTARDRYHVCKRTIDRWEKDKKLGFPKPLVVNGRKLDNEDQLDLWDAACAARGRATRTTPKGFTKSVAADMAAQALPDRTAEGVDNEAAQASPDAAPRPRKTRTAAHETAA